MFHVSDNLYFGRMNSAGDVRLIHFKSVQSVPPDANGVYSAVNVYADLLVPGTVWPSVMAAVSLRGSIENRYYVAQAFHNNVEALAAWASRT